MSGRRTKPRTSLQSEQQQRLIEAMRACRLEAIYANVTQGPLAHGLEMLRRSLDAAAIFLIGERGHLRPDHDLVRLPATDTPRNRYLLLAAMQRCRGELSLGLDFHSPLNAALEMVRRAIDAVALLLTGSEDLFWEKGSSLAPGAHEASLAEQATAQAECERELAERASSSAST